MAGERAAGERDAERCRVVTWSGCWAAACEAGGWTRKMRGAEPARCSGGEDAAAARGAAVVRGAESAVRSSRGTWEIGLRIAWRGDSPPSPSSTSSASTAASTVSAASAAAVSVAASAVLAGCLVSCVASSLARSVGACCGRGGGRGGGERCGTGCGAARLGSSDGGDEAEGRGGA